MPRFADRVQETTTTTGLGDITLGGAVSTYQPFSAEFAVGVRAPYAIEHQSANEFETGIGYLSSATVFVRERVETSSNANALVNFSAGTKNIFHTVLAKDVSTVGRAVAQINRLPWF